MRAYTYCLLFMFSLSGCAYYGDIHGNAKPLQASELAAHTQYQIPPLKIKTGEWWSVFKDPQLNQLIKVAIIGSPNMKTAEVRVRRAKHLAEESASTLWPSLDLSGNVAKEHFSTYGLIPPPFNGSTFNIGEVLLNFNYEFDFWGKNRQTLAARVSEECAALADQAEARLVIATAVASTYFQLLSNLEQLKIAKDNAKQTKEIAAIVLTRAKRGVDSDIPLGSALAGKQSTILTVEQYRNAVLLARHQLAELMGKNAFTTKIVAEKFSFHAYPVSLPAMLPAHLIATRPDIIAARARAEAAAHEINVAKALFFPDINLNGLFSYQSVGLGHLFDPKSQTNGVTAAFDLPIFDAGARRANLGVKYAEYDIAVQSYNQTILNALRDVADQLSTMRTLTSQIKAQALALSSTRNNYKLFKARYNHGIVTYTQVLEIRQLLLQQESTQRDLQARHLLAVVAMLKALGGNEL